MKLTAPQVRALRFYAATHDERRAFGFPFGGLPRRDVTDRLQDAGLIENVPDPMSFDMVATDEGRRLLAELDGQPS